jgi:hypothetical protein
VREHLHSRRGANRLGERDMGVVWSHRLTKMSLIRERRHLYLSNDSFAVQLNLGKPATGELSGTQDIAVLVG